MGWSDYHTRRDLMTDALGTATRTGDGRLPWAPALARAFDSREDLLLALQLRWAQHLSGALEAEAHARSDDRPLATRA